MDAMMPQFSAAGLIDPDTMSAIEESVQDAIKKQVELQTKPMHPKWYREKDYPNPDPAKAFSHVIDIEAQFGPLREQIANDLRKLNYEQIAVFKGHDRNKDEVWPSSAIVAELELTAYQLADSELSFMAPATTIADEDESERKIDFAYACMDDAERQHMASGNGPYRLEMARTLLTTGRLVWHVTLNLDADEGEMPFNETLLDPATCYPVYEGKRGMRSMSRRYSTTIADVIGSFSSADNDLQYLVEPRDKEGKFQKARKPTDNTVVSEYWDRRWRIVWMDGQVIVGPLEHGFSFVPFVYQLGGLGLPAYQKDPTSLTATDVQVWTPGVSLNSHDISNPHKGVSLIRLLRVPHDVQEMVFSKLINAFDTSVHPPMTLELDDLAYIDGVPEISVDKKAINPLKMGRHRLSAIPTDPSSQLMNPILNGMSENLGRLIQPPSAHGENDKSNVSGYAVNSGNQAGMVKTVPHKKGIESFVQQCMEMRFRMYRDYGHLVKQGEYGRQGELTVPIADAEPGGARAFLLTPMDLRTTGVKMKASLNNLPIQMLGPVGNAVGMLMDKNLMTQARALAIMGDPNPQKTIRRIRYDKILNDPAIQDMEIYEGLKSQGMTDAAELFLQMKMGGGAASPTGAAPPMNEGSVDPMGGSPVTATVGDSNAAYGFGPGPGSGPQGPLGPRQ